MKRNFIAIILLYLSAVCSVETVAQKSITVFELGKNLSKASELKMSDLATDISYIPLELTPKSLLSGINVILPAGNVFIVATRNSKLKVFDKNGKYLNDIGYSFHAWPDWFRFRQTFFIQYRGYRETLYDHAIRCKSSICARLPASFILQNWGKGSFHSHPFRYGFCF